MDPKPKSENPVTAEEDGMKSVQSWLDRSDPRAAALAVGNEDEAERKKAALAHFERANRIFYMRECARDGIRATDDEATSCPIT